MSFHINLRDQVNLEICNMLVTISMPDVDSFDTKSGKGREKYKGPKIIFNQILCP